MDYFETLTKQHLEPDRLVDQTEFDLDLYVTLTNNIKLLNNFDNFVINRHT